MRTVSPDSYYARLVYDCHNPFFGAALKVKRANRHIHELADAARELPRLRPIYFAIGQAQPGQLEINHMPKRSMPIEFDGVLGDVIHNLRAAFDHIAVALCSPPIGNGNSKNAYFPTGKDRKEFEAQLERKMKGATPAGKRLIEELEPYGCGRNHSIRPSTISTFSTNTNC